VSTDSRFGDLHVSVFFSVFFFFFFGGGGGRGNRDGGKEGRSDVEGCVCVNKETKKERKKTEEGESADVPRAREIILFLLYINCV
jgi:hypothetical protein